MPAIASNYERSASRIDTPRVAPGPATGTRLHHAGNEFESAKGNENNTALVSTTVGFDWQWSAAISAYAGYGEMQRAPRATETNCTPQKQACGFPQGFVIEPPLQQVVSRTFEAGVHGQMHDGDDASMHWSLVPFVTVSEDEIAFVNTGPGSGYFENVGKTRRTGIEAAISAVNGRLRWFANYAYIRATVEDSFLVLIEHSPAANAVGELEMDRADRLPGIPLHSAKMGISYTLTPRWQLALDSITTSSRVLRGHEGNSQLRVDGFTIISARGSYRLQDNLEAFLLAENIFDTEYENFGTFGDPAEVPLREFGYPASDPRFLGPGAPRGVWVGLRFSH